MTWSSRKLPPPGWQPAGLAGRRQRDEAGRPPAAARAGNPWFLLKALPALERAAGFAAGTERPDAAAALRSVELGLAGVGNAPARQRALGWLRLLLDELAAAGDSGAWGPAGLNPRLDAPAEAAALRADRACDPGLLHLLDACRLLSPSAGRTPPVGLPAAGPDPFAAIAPIGGGTAHRLVLAGSPGAGKSSLLRHARRRVRARELSNLAGIAPQAGEQVIQVEAVAGAAITFVPPVAADAVLVLTGLDRIDGWDELFPSPSHGGLCGVQAAAGEGAAPRLAGALAAQLLRRLASDRDPGRRAAMIGAAGRLAATCERLARAGAGGSGWAAIYLSAAPPGGRPAFVERLFDGVTEPAPASAWRAEIVAALAFLLIGLAGLAIAGQAAGPASDAAAR